MVSTDWSSTATTTDTGTTQWIHVVCDECPRLRVMLDRARQDYRDEQDWRIRCEATIGSLLERLESEREINALLTDQLKATLCITTGG